MVFKPLIIIQFILIGTTAFLHPSVETALIAQSVITGLYLILIKINKKRSQSLVSLIIDNFNNPKPLMELIETVNLKVNTNILINPANNVKFLTLKKYDKEYQLSYTNDWEKEVVQTIIDIYPAILAAKNTAITLEKNAKLSALGEIAAGIAHEINNPVAIVFGKAQMINFQIQEALESQTPVDMKELEKNNNDIIDTVNRIDKIINSLRYFVRDDSRNPVCEAKVDEILDNVQVLSIDRCKKNGVKVKITKEIPEDLIFLCKPTQISQVLINLINNSFDAIQSLPEKWIHIHCFQEDKSLVFEVSDSGTGISEEIKNKILKNFYTNKVTTKTSGLGIGLSIAKRIIDQHFGTITIKEGVPNTTFVVRIPIRRENV